MSNPATLPRQYSASALNYILSMSSNANSVATTLGIQATALVAGMAREMTRTPYMSPLEQAGKDIGIYLLSGMDNAELLQAYKSEVAAFNANPQSFSNSTAFSLNSGLDALKLDVGPGHIRVFTALQELNEYGNTAIGEQLGLTQYLGNYKQFVADLTNQDSDLSVKIAGLVALDAQNYFESVAGQQFFADGADGTEAADWEELSQGQRDALTSSYYTSGQAAVNAKVQSDTYTPFTDPDTGAAFVEVSGNDSLLAGVVSGNTINTTTQTITPDGSNVTTETVTLAGITLSKVVETEFNGVDTIERYGNGNLSNPYQVETIDQTDPFNVYDTIENYDSDGNLESTSQTVTGKRSDIGEQNLIGSGEDGIVSDASPAGIFNSATSLTSTGNGTWTLVTTDSSGTQTTISLTNVQSVAPNSNGGYSIIGASGAEYTLGSFNSESDDYQLASTNGDINLEFAQSNIAAISLGATVTVTNNVGDVLSLDGQGGTGSISFVGSTGVVAVGDPSLIEIGANAFNVSPANGGVGSEYSFGPDGEEAKSAIGILIDIDGDYQTDASNASIIESEVDNAIGIDSPPGSVVNSLINVQVQQLSQIGGTNDGTGGDGMPIGGSDVVFQQGGVTISATGQGDTDVGSLTSSSIANGYWRPYYEDLLDSFNNVPAALGLFNDPGSVTLPGEFASPVPIDDLSPAAVDTDPDPSFTDPLLLDLTGNGINVSNWVTSPVYFDTNVLPDANGNPPTTADGMEHETAWMKPGTAMLVFESDGTVTPITNITQTVSEFLNAGLTPGEYADGLAALAALTQSGATVFSASTALIDPTTGVSYWDEIMVWNDANSNGVSDPGEIVSLASLGIASISLEGSGDQGESINGNAVTNQTTYTKTDGTAGEAAAVDFENDSIGDIATSATGGVLINSLSEGGPTLATTYVAQNTSAHSYTIDDGKLTDTTTGTVLASSGLTAILSTTQSDTITVAASDTDTYWLGGGTGADTLTGGGGTNVFLVNANTIVHGGTGANSFNIAKVVGTQGVTINLAADHLQEVIGGPGGDILNASGTTWNVFIQAGDGNNIIIGGAATDAISGGTGDDLIEAGPGGSVIHAGTGDDLIYGGNGASEMTQPSYVNAGTSSNAAYVERLYNGGLGREADLGGFQTYTNALNSGATPTAIATDFVNSTEWQTKYGTQTNTQFVTSIFENFLGRPPSSTELNQFVTALNDGQTRGVALETVATSAQSETYWGGLHPGASDVIYGGPGNDTIVLGTNNSEVYDGTGTMTVVGNPDGFAVVGFHGSYADYKVTHNAGGTITVTDIGDEGDGTVTLKNVTDLDFSDISQIPIDGTAGMPVDDHLETSDASEVTTNGEGQYVIAASTLLANDIDYAGNTLSIRELLGNNGNAIARGSSGQVNGGTAALSSDGSTITFTPNASYTGVMSFRYHIEDNMGNDGAIVQQVGTTNTAEMTATVYLNTPSDPTDPLFDSEWYLQAANVLPVWQEYTGAGVSVGVFDPSGNVDFSNPDLAPNAGQSINNDGDPGVQQLGTHATLVAGVIGAARDGEGAVGVAYDATIGSVSLPSAGGNVANLIDWQNYDVVNNSWTLSPPVVDNFVTNPSYEQAYIDAVDNGRGGLGTILVFAGGNSRAEGGTTEDLNETNSRFGITVGGIDATTDLGSLVISGAPFSNPGASILVSAPANNITSDGVSFTNDFGQEFGADSETAEGTSFAAPIVSGVVALMLQANPDLGYRDIQEILAYSATMVDPTDSTWSYNGADNWNGGGLHTSEDYGFGEVDALAAVRLAATWQFQDTAFNEESINFNEGTFSTAASGATSLNHAIPTEGASTQTIDLTFPTTPYDELNVEHVDIELNLSDVIVDDLIVKLIAPSGETSVLLDDAENPTGQANDGTPQNLDYTLDTVKDWGELSGGTWQLEIAYAPGTTPVGTLDGVNATIYGSSAIDPYTGTQPQTYIYTDEFTGAPGASRSTLEDATGSSDSINVSATTGAVVLDLAAGSTDSSVDGRSLTIASDTHIDQVYLGDGAGTIYGNDDGNTYVAGTGDDTVYGGAGNNTFFAGGANGLPQPVGTDTFYGGSASNTFYLGTGVADIIGGTGYGTNALDFEYAPAAVTVNFETGINGGAAAGDSFSNIQEIIGSNYDDTISAWGGVTLDGGAGVNTLDYSDAPDGVTVNFDYGQAQVGSLAMDTISDFQKIVGSSGDDDVVDGPGLVSADGGAGTNTLDFSLDPTGVSVNLTTGAGTDGFADAMTISNFQYVYGSSYSSNVITGASDTIDIQGSWYGGDRITATSAYTTMDFSGSLSGVNVNLATDVNTGGSAQGDILSGVEEVDGSAYNDNLTGNADDNQFDPYFGNDTMTGGGGYDVYYYDDIAGYGRDTIINGVASDNEASGEVDLGYEGSNNVLPDNIWLQRVGNNLQIDVMGTNSEVTIQGWYSNTYSQLEHIVADNGQTLDTNLNALVTAMASYSAAHPTFNPTSAANPTITDPTLLADVNADWDAAPDSMTALSASAGTGNTADGSNADLQRLVQAMAGMPNRSLAALASHESQAYLGGSAALAAASQQQHQMAHS